MNYPNVARFNERGIYGLEIIKKNLLFREYCLIEIFILFKWSAVFCCDSRIVDKRFFNLLLVQ